MGVAQPEGVLSSLLHLLPDVFTPPHRGVLWRDALETLLARGWQPEDILFAIDALDGVEDRSPAPTPHRVASCLVGGIRAREILDDRAGRMNTWEERVSSLVRSRRGMRALLVVAAAFWDDDEVGHAIDAACAA